MTHESQRPWDVSERYFWDSIVEGAAEERSNASAAGRGSLSLRLDDGFVG